MQVSVYLSISISTSLSVYFFLSIHLSTYLPISLFIWVTIRQYVFLVLILYSKVTLCCSGFLFGLWIQNSEFESRSEFTIFLKSFYSLTLPLLSIWCLFYLSIVLSSTTTVSYFVFVLVNEEIYIFGIIIERSWQRYR